MYLEKCLTHKHIFTVHLGNTYHQAIFLFNMETRAIAQQLIR